MKLYVWSTPNGEKPVLAAEELELRYEIVPVDIGAGAQHEEAFGAKNLFRRIPVLEEGDLVLAESGAILVHLAEKHGALLAAEGEERAQALRWLMFQVGHVGPMLGQAWHFMKVAPEKTPEPLGYATTRYAGEAKHVLSTLDARLAEAPFLAGDAYSIADVATYPWAKMAGAFVNEGELPHLKRWLDTIAARPATQRLAELDLKTPSTQRG